MSFSLSNEERQALNDALRKLGEGDRSVARFVFDTLWPRVRAFCVRALGPSRGEDVAQKSLVTLFGRASQFDPSGDALAWALELASWEVRTDRRKSLRAKEKLLEPSDLRAASGAPLPDAELEAAELKDALEVAVGSLSEQDQETLRTVLLEADPPVQGATWRKRKERALTRLGQAWRTLYGNH